ncbi:MAG: hypothetical protein ACE5FJ_03800 [Gemmatimonadales bacterium]
MSYPIRDTRRTIIALLAFIAGGAVPIQLVTLSFGYAQYVRKVGMGPRVIAVAHEFAAWYIPLIYLPAIVLLVAIAIHSKQRYPDIFRRIGVGLGMGAVATIALDTARQAGVIHGWLPADTFVMFGKMATGSSSFSVFYPAGILVHYLNGANFGLFYSFVWGKRKSYTAAVGWATFWLLLVELGMMTLPPMAPIVGPFGINFAWPQLFLLTLVAHVMFGVTLGLLVQHFLSNEDRAWLVPFLLGQSTLTTSPPSSAAPTED